MKKLWKCKTCSRSFQSKNSLDHHWLSCWEKNQGKKFFDLLNINSNILRKHKTPIPNWAAEKNIKFEKIKPILKTNEARKNNNQPRKKSPTIKTFSAQLNCSCKGENENCFKCNGTGLYESLIVTNIEECKDRIHEKQIQKTNSIQESQFSNDPRGGIYGIRENGRYSSNPLHEEDI